MISITKIFHFEAAHFLPSHKGKCKNLHGHSYKVEVEVAGKPHKEGEEKGMVMDFGRLKKIVTEEIIDKLDHTILNESIQINNDFPTTAENLCSYIAEILMSIGIDVVHVRVWETQDSHADWRDYR
jgi:6-pyruvoyltetrahydropterin/6-carboxytetrahydropterin synthase